MLKEFVIYLRMVKLQEILELLHFTDEESEV